MFLSNSRKHNAVSASFSLDENKQASYTQKMKLNPFINFYATDYNITLSDFDAGADKIFNFSILLRIFFLLFI